MHFNKRGYRTHDMRIRKYVASTAHHSEQTSSKYYNFSKNKEVRDFYPTGNNLLTQSQVNATAACELADTFNSSTCPHHRRIGYALDLVFRDQLLSPWFQALEWENCLKEIYYLLPHVFCLNAKTLSNRICLMIIMYI